MHSQSVLGVRIDSSTVEDFLATAKAAITSKERQTLRIYTPNPEMLVRAQADTYYKDVLNAGSINLCDGTGIVLCSRIIHPTQLPITRITGTDFMDSICAIAEQTGASVYFLGSGDRSAVQGTADYVKTHYPKLTIAGLHPGIPMRIVERTIEHEQRGVLSHDESLHDDMIHDIILSAPDILFVAFGHEKQEKWIDEHVKDLPSVRVAMGVGGAFDFYAAKVRRAPSWLRAAGLEWLWRVLVEPHRWKRILTAVILFPLLMVKDRLNS